MLFSELFFAHIARFSKVFNQLIFCILATTVYFYWQFNFVLLWTLKFLDDPKIVVIKFIHTFEAKIFPTMFFQKWLLKVHEGSLAATTLFSFFRGVQFVVLLFGCSDEFLKLTFIYIIFGSANLTSLVWTIFADMSRFLTAPQIFVAIDISRAFSTFFHRMWHDSNY